jgi:diguanylate cyclase (GGDEF)-like protein/PAS domain S-box-containing protein
MPQSQRLFVRDIASRTDFEQATPARKAQVHAAHIRIFYELNREAAAVTLVVALLLLWIFWVRVPKPALLTWSAIVLALAAVRFVFSRRFMRLNPPDAAMRRWSTGAWLGAVLQGLVWGALPFIVVNGGSDADLLLTVFVLCAFGFGAFAMLGFYLPAYIGFSFSILMLLTAWFIGYVPEAALEMVLLVIVACVVMSRAGLRASRVLQGALLLAIERTANLREVTAEKERIAVTLQAVGDGVITTGIDGRVTSLNAIARRLTGWGDEAEGRPVAEVLQLVDGPAPDLVTSCLMRDDLVAVDEDRRLLSKDGMSETAVRIKASPIRTADQRVIGVVIVLHDVTELAGLAQTLRYQSAHDDLTGLFNRRAFEEALGEAVHHSRRLGGAHCLCYLDLDQFKIVNDTCGHAAGDQLLQQLADQLRARVRGGDIVARLGGDEFGVLLFRCGLERAQRVADDLAGMFRSFRFAWDGSVFNVGVSIGLVPFEGGADPAQILATADAACYLAKEDGRNRVYLARPGDVELASRHGEMRLTSHIQRALDESLFRLRFQKIAPLRGAAPLKGEFLVSMLSEEGALLAPAAFLPAAERFNMMPKLDRHVVRLALQLIAEDRPELRGVDTFSVNLSGQSLADESFLPFLVEQISNSGIDARRLCFEITETAVISHLGRALALIRRLRAMGCRFALDDFGAGLSSFGYLRSLPVDYLKIDGQFVRNMCSDPVNRSIVEAVHRVSGVMGLQTIAESVEDETTADALRELGVDFAQGWHFQRPVLLQP